MPVVVRPAEFSMVHFDAAEIRRIGEALAAQIGLPADLEVTLDIDETTPLGRSSLTSVNPAVLSFESGALEDAKAPRALSEAGATDVIGRLLFELRDRLDPDFGEVPLEADLSLAEATAWQVHCVGRLSRLGHRVQRQRRLYQFRNRHGFTDVADAAFDRLWRSDRLTWAEIRSLSDAARDAQPA